MCHLICGGEKTLCRLWEFSFVKEVIHSIGLGGMLNGNSSFGPTGASQQQSAGSNSPGRIAVQPAPIDDLTSVQFSEEIQNEANMYFQQVN